MSTDAIRQARSRSKRKQEGKTEVRVWLSPEELKDLDALVRNLGPGYGYNNRSAGLIQAFRSSCGLGMRA